jgi:hypothetical protein
MSRGSQIPGGLASEETRRTDERRRPGGSDRACRRAARLYVGAQLCGSCWRRLCRVSRAFLAHVPGDLTFFEWTLFAWSTICPAAGLVEPSLSVGQ